MASPCIWPPWAEKTGLEDRSVYSVFSIGSSRSQQKFAVLSCFLPKKLHLFLHVIGTPTAASYQRCPYVQGEDVNHEKQKPVGGLGSEALSPLAETEHKVHRRVLCKPCSSHTLPYKEQEKVCGEALVGAEGDLRPGQEGIRKEPADRRGSQISSCTSCPSACTMQVCGVYQAQSTLYEETGQK